MNALHFLYCIPFICIVSCTMPIANTQTSRECATGTIHQLVKESLAIGDDFLLRELLFPASQKSPFDQVDKNEVSFMKAVALIQAAKYWQYQNTLFSFYHGSSPNAGSERGNDSNDSDREQMLECISRWSEAIENGSLDVKNAKISFAENTASVRFFAGESLTYTLSLEKRWTPEHSFFWIVVDYSIGAIS